MSWLGALIVGISLFASATIGAAIVASTLSDIANRNRRTYP